MLASELLGLVVQVAHQAIGVVGRLDRRRLYLGFLGGRLLLGWLRRGPRRSGLVGFARGGLCGFFGRRSAGRRQRRRSREHHKAHQARQQGDRKPQRVGARH